MVARISSGKSLFGALAYNQEKVDQKNAKVLGGNLIREPASGEYRIGKIMEDFMNHMPSHYRTKNPVFHASINPHPDDKLTDADLTEIGREYMEKLGYGGQPYIIFKHDDISRGHIHIVSVRVKSDGSKIYDSMEGKRSEKITEDLEEKYNLHPAKGQKYEDIRLLSKVDTSKGEVKKQIASVIRMVEGSYHFQSMGEYKAILSLYNIGIEEVKGEAAGKPYKGILYGVLDKKGEKIGKQIKSSIFGKKFGYKGLEKRMQTSKEKIKKEAVREKLKKVVSEALSKSPDEVSFRKNLHEKNVDLVLRRSEEGRIYGVTFIDHSSRTILNGSRLGKEFSANQIEEHFNREIPDQTHTTENISIKEEVPFESIGGLNIAGAVDSLLDVISFENSDNSDPGKTSSNKKRNKKRRYGRQI